MISTILLVITIIAFGFYVFKNPPNNASTLQNTTITPNTSISTNICMDYSDEKMNKLDIDLVRNMITGYRNNQKTHIDSAMGIDDAYSIWFDLETLKKFIYHTEYNASLKKHIVKNPELGLRIYYSRYPEYNNWEKYRDLDKLTTDYVKLHTLIAIPTIKRSDDENVDFNPLDETTYLNGMPYDYPGTTTTTDTPSVPSFGVVERNNSNLSVNAQNHGGLIPPAPPTPQAF